MSLLCHFQRIGEVDVLSRDSPHHLVVPGILWLAVWAPHVRLLDIECEDRYDAKRDPSSQPLGQLQISGMAGKETGSERLREVESDRRDEILVSTAGKRPGEEIVRERRVRPAESSVDTLAHHTGADVKI